MSKLTWISCLKNFKIFGNENSRKTTYMHIGIKKSMGKPILKL